MGALLKVQGLKKSFGHHQVLNGVDFTVQTGHIVGLVGPNGAGKSTIMKAVLGLIPVNGGRIQIAGEPVAITSHQALRNVGALIEYPGIYPFLTGMQHLELFAKKKNRAEHIQRIVTGLGMASYINAKAKSYSLGMKQKLGIAQALVNRPRLVILDEPMNGLDPQAVKDLRDLIEAEAKNGTSFLISSHILSELEKLADDVLLLNGGRIIQQTSMRDLETANGVLYTLQTVDDHAAAAAITAAGLTLEPGPGVTIRQTTNATTLNMALVAVVNAGINVQGIEQSHPDLESTFLQMIDANTGKEA